MSLVYDNTRPASRGGGWIEWNGPLDDSPGGWLTELNRRRQMEAARLAREKGRWMNVARVAGAATAIPFAAAAAPALMSLGSIGGGAAGGAAAAAPAAGTAATVGGISTALSGGVPWLRLAEIGAPTVMNLLGLRSSNRAANRAHELELAGLRQSQVNFDRQFELERDAFDADQEQRRLDRLAADEERAYTRRLSDEREGRRAPFRTIGRNALYSLANIAGVRY